MKTEEEVYNHLEKKRFERIITSGGKPLSLPKFYDIDSEINIEIEKELDII